MNDNHKVNIALCGCGRMGEVHFQTLVTHPNVHLVAVVDVDFKRAQIKAEVAQCKAFHTLSDLLSDKTMKLHAILICTPTDTHTKFIREGLLAGVHVLCEKPISNVVEEVDDLYHLAKEKGLHLLCGFHRRYDPNFSKLKTILESGKVGKLIKVRSISRDNPLHVSLEYLKVSGGIIADTASHDIDMIRFITGEDPETVYVVANAFSPDIAAIGDHDQCEMIFKFPSGVIGTIDISRNAAYGYDQRVEILAHQGSIIVENQKPTTVIVGGTEGFLLEPPCFSFPQRYSEAYKTEVHHFVNLVRGVDKTPKLTHGDVHNITVILRACQQSLKDGNPVKIKLN